tara:strand:- start:567 stop:1577 length:1011 start_codon:yes stop_codon:yes gene_type:complete
MRQMSCVLVAALFTGCASSKPADTPPEKTPLLDRTQQAVYGVTSGAARKIDSFFGSADVEEQATVSRGRLAVGGQWDERKELQERVSLKARVALPAINDRTSLIFGRGEADELVDGSGNDKIDSLPTRFNDYEDDDWLLGFGYARDAKLKRGWSFGTGVRLTSPLEPFVRATYRWNTGFGDDWLWRVEPRIFLQSQRGAGVSLKNTLDHAVNEDWLLRSSSVAVLEEDVEGVAWTSKLIAYQSLAEESAMSYAIYSTGETDAEVPVRDYGIEVRYRRQVLRKWFFIEYLTYLSWPREFLFEEREPVVGVGIEFEMQFGHWPGRSQCCVRDSEAAGD